MIKYLYTTLLIVIIIGCGHPERKLTNKKNSSDSLVKNSGDTATVKAPDEEAMHENRFDVERISGKSKQEISQYLGEPSSEETVTVRGDIPNCEKVTYIDGLIEVIFINSKADWVKIRDDPSMVLIPRDNKYVSIEKFPDYIFVKTFTK